MIFKNNKFVLLYINFWKKNYFFENQYAYLNKLGNLTSFVYFFIYFFKNYFFLLKEIKKKLK